MPWPKAEAKISFRLLHRTKYAERYFDAIRSLGFKDFAELSDRWQGCLLEPEILENLFI